MLVHETTSAAGDCGGGFGDPALRDPGMAAADLADRRL
jgi:hypothetical protein